MSLSWTACPVQQERLSARSSYMGREIRKTNITIERIVKSIPQDKRFQIDKVSKGRRDGGE